MSSKMTANLSSHPAKLIGFTFYCVIALIRDEIVPPLIT